jgi:hypothetical protein
VSELLDCWMGGYLLRYEDRQERRELSNMSNSPTFAGSRPGEGPVEPFYDGPSKHVLQESRARLAIGHLPRNRGSAAATTEATA